MNTNHARNQGVAAGMLRTTLLLTVGLLGAPDTTHLDAQRQAVGEVHGQSATQLSDGATLLVGGVGASGPTTTVLVRPRGTSQTIAVGTLHQPRAWHSATLLADGTIVVIGGLDADGAYVASVEVIDLITGAVQRLRGPRVARAHHTATLLPSGQVLIAGGSSASAAAHADAELWDPATDAIVAVVPMRRARRGHVAELLADGTVQLDAGTGADRSGTVERFDPAAQAFVEAPVPSASPDLSLTLAQPADGATDVPAGVRMALLFSRPLDVTTVGAGTVSLHGPDGGVEALVVAAEGGRLVFVSPRTPLAGDAHYALALGGLADLTGAALPPTAVTFRTARDVSTPDADVPEWTPDPDGADRWETGRARSSSHDVPPRRAPDGTTALAGRVLAIDDAPLSNVRVELGRVSTTVDGLGRFLLEGVAAGMYEIGVDAQPDRTTVLPDTIWLTPIDRARATPLPQGPGGAAQAITSPRMPGVRIDVPAGVTLRSPRVGRLTELTMTPLPIDRPPIALPPGVQPFALFTVQTHDAVVEDARGEASGIRIAYPNTLGLPPGAPVELWSYDAGRGWVVDGRARVTPDGRRVEPDPGVRLPRVRCVQFAAPPQAPPTGPPGGGPTDGDPVDLATGLFVYEKTDIALPDVLPIVLTRTYRQDDHTSRAFGIGTSHAYDLFLIGDSTYTWADLILPDGGRVPFVRTSGGTGYASAVMEHATAPGPFFKATLHWNNARAAWDLTRRDGVRYEFGTAGATGVRLIAIVDRSGNRLRIERSGAHVSRIVSPHGRTLDFTLDGSNRVTSVTDHIGRQITYTYDGSGRL
jgi:hypothetical protein